MEVLLQCSPNVFLFLGRANGKLYKILMLATGAPKRATCFLYPPHVIGYHCFVMYCTKLSCACNKISTSSDWRLSRSLLITLVWNMTPFSLAHEYQRCGRTRWFCLLGRKGSFFAQYSGIRRSTLWQIDVSSDGDFYTVIPRLTKIIRSGITFVSRNLR